MIRIRRRPLLVLEHAKGSDMIDVLGLEERGFNAWPAPHKVYFGGWVFRLGGGYTKRANSANALGGGGRQEMRADSINAWTPKRDFREVMAEAERFYAANGQPAIFRLTPARRRRTPTRLLEAAGYERLDPSTVMTAPLGAAAPDARVTAGAGSDAGLAQRHRGGAGRRAVAPADPRPHRAGDRAAGRLRDRACRRRARRGSASASPSAAPSACSTSSCARNFAARASGARSRAR